MPWPYPHGITVTVHRAPADPRTRDRGRERKHDLKSCGYDRGAPRRDDDAGDDGGTATATVYAAYDADVQADDEISLPGVPGRWLVDGEVLRHRSVLTGIEACSEIRLTRRRGA